VAGGGDVEGDVLGGVEICGAGDAVGGRLRGTMGTCGEGGGEGNVVGHWGGGMIDGVEMLWRRGGVWMLGYNCVYDVGLFARKSLYQKANCLSCTEIQAGILETLYPPFFSSIHIPTSPQSRISAKP